MADTQLQTGNRKLVVLGIPWEINTDGLKQYMSKYGSLDDVVVMEDRRTGRSRGFGYVTFSTSESAEKCLAAKHTINGRELEVKVATPKEEMKNPPKKITRIFVARIPLKVSEEEFRRYFEKFGPITDIYMPKDSGSRSHRGIGFITFESPDAVSKVMEVTHELGGSTVAVDEATPKDEGGKGSWRNDYHRKYSDNDYLPRYYDREYSGAYGAYSPYIASGAGGPRPGGYGALSPYGSYDYGDYRPSRYRSWSSIPPPLSGPSSRSGFSSSAGQTVIRNKIFVGKLPSEATTDDLRQYFGNFGRISDVFLPKDSTKKGHRGFAFVTFTDEGPAERVCRRSHELLGHEIAVDHASPPDDDAPRDGFFEGSGMYGSGPGSGYSGSSYRNSFDYYGSWGGSYGGVGPMLDNDRPSRDYRYRPY